MPQLAFRYPNTAFNTLLFPLAKLSLFLNGSPVSVTDKYFWQSDLLVRCPLIITSNNFGSSLVTYHTTSLFCNGEPSTQSVTPSNQYTMISVLLDFNITNDRLLMFWSSDISPIFAQAQMFLHASAYVLISKIRFDCLNFGQC